jgi:hypothetical protein
MQYRYLSERSLVEDQRGTGMMWLAVIRQFMPPGVDVVLREHDLLPKEICTVDMVKFPGTEERLKLLGPLIERAETS